MRGGQPLESAIEHGLFHTIHARLQISELDGSSPNPTRPLFNTTTRGPLPPQAQFWKLMRDVSQSSSKIQSIAKRCSQGSGVPTADLTETLKGAFSVHCQLLAWKTSLPAELKYQAYIIPDMAYHNGQLAFSTKFILFTDIPQAAMWISYWCSQIHIIQNLVLGLGILRQISDDALELAISKNDLQTHVLKTVDDICASVAYMLGDVDEKGDLRVGSEVKALGPFFMLRGLLVVNMVDGISTAQRRWVQECLLRIGHQWGVKTALRSRINC